MSISGAHTAPFFDEIVREAREAQVWTIRDSEGIPAPAVSGGMPTVPFSSLASRAAKITSKVGAYADQLSPSNSPSCSRPRIHFDRHSRRGIATFSNLGSGDGLIQPVAGLVVFTGGYLDADDGFRGRDVDLPFVVAGRAGTGSAGTARRRDQTSASGSTSR
jgi:hypothetical protein